MGWELQNDAILRVPSSAFCGYDPHMYSGIMQGMGVGEIVGHEFMGE